MDKLDEVRQVKSRLRDHLIEKLGYEPTMGITPVGEGYFLKVNIRSGDDKTRIPFVFEGYSVVIGTIGPLRKLETTSNLPPTVDDLRRAAFVESDLLPCPFCGSKVLSSGFVNEQTENYVSKIFCGRLEKCGVSMSMCLGKVETREEADRLNKERWNRRHENRQA